MNNKNIINVFCIWADLLGFGAPLANCGWFLGDDKAINSLKRLENVQHCFAESGFMELEKGFVLNDGIAKSTDFISSNKISNRYIWWFDRTLLQFSIMKDIDMKYGNPGVRAVWTTGTRYTYRDDTITADRFAIAGSKEMQKILKETVLVYSPYEFQMNTAFSKAYIMESGGSKIGLCGPYLYIDVDLLNTMEEYLTKDEHTIEVTVDKIEKNSISISNKVIPVKYKVKLNNEGDILHWSVNQIREKKEIQMISLYLENKPTDINFMGIQTKLYKALKYSPLDEENDYEIEL